MTTVNLELDGRRLSLDSPPSSSLADALRGAGATSVHLGCEQGVCGACTVLLDGRSVRACLVLAVQADGRSVLTAAGVGGRLPDLWARIESAFLERRALQCGFCTPAMVVCLAELLGAEQPVSAEQLEAQLSGQLCRCTGYAPIREAFTDVLAAAGLFEQAGEGR